MGSGSTRSDLVMRGTGINREGHEGGPSGRMAAHGGCGYLDDEGYLYLVDRKNNKVIITGG